MWALACLCAAPAAAQGARVYEDREAGIRLAAPPGARFTRLTDGDWRFTRGSFSFNVYFDFEVDPNKSGPEPAKAYVRANQGTFLSLLGARPVAYGTVPVAGGSAVSLAYQARHGRARAKGTYVFLATPGCMVTFAFQTTPRSYAVHQRLFSDALRSVQTFPSQPPDATLVPLKIRQLPDVNVRLPVTADWTYRQETATTHLFEGRQGSINVLQEALRRYVPSDAQIVVRTALEKSRPLRPKVEWEGALRVHGWPAYMARCRYGSGTTAFYVELLVVIQGEKLCRMEVLGPERYAPYLQKLTERIRGEWKLGSAGPAEAGPPGELKYAMEEVREAGLALELPEDWRPMDAFEGLSAFGGGLGSLVVAVPP
ncbi:MAG TPA: hypothetical protein VK689_09150, partial [Armatimonadota bacterium]|nr:hypothetical protein [Armatimonadota bacterium]